MDTKTTLSISEARKKIFRIVDEVQTGEKYFTLTENGKPKAVILSVEEFESLEEMIETIKKFPDLKNDLEKVEEDVRRGEYKNYAALEEMLAADGFVVADKSRVTYGVPNTTQSSIRKRAKKASFL